VPEITDEEYRLFEECKAEKAALLQKADLDRAIEAKECQAYLAMKAGKYPHEIDSNLITEADLEAYRADKLERAELEAQAQVEAELALFNQTIADKVKVRLIYDFPLGDMVDLYGVRFNRDGLEHYGYTEADHANQLAADGLVEVSNG
jgi:hypothetical protein